MIEHSKKLQPSFWTKRPTQGNLKLTLIKFGLRTKYLQNEFHENQSMCVATKALERLAILMHNPVQELKPTSYYS